MRYEIVILLFCFLFWGCNSGSDSSDIPTINAPGSNPGVTVSAMSGFGALSASLKMSSTSGDVAASSATFKIASYPQYDKTANSNGEVAISNLIPGTYTIYTTATLPAAQAFPRDVIKDGSTVRAAQFRNITVAADAVTTLPSSTVLSTPGSISGTVELINNPNNVTLDGILVYIPGTSYSAYTDASGVFSMTNIPAGTYDLVKFSKTGLTESQVENVVVASGTDTAISSTVRMSLSTGPSGEISGIASTSSVSINSSSVDVLQSNSVTVNLKYDTRAVLMKLAHESAFLNVNWVPVSTTYTFTAANNSSANTAFSTDGTKTVYAKFADSNGLESSVYTKEFVIDNDSPTLSSISLMNGWGYAGNTDQGDGVYATQKVPVTFSASDSGTGVKQLMLCNNSSFTGCSWETYSASRSDWDLSDNTAGSKTVYAKVRDYLDRESSNVSSDIVVSTYTLVPSSQTSSVTLIKKTGPYSWDSGISFEGNLTIEAGTHLYYTATTGDLTVAGNLEINGTSTLPVKLIPESTADSIPAFILNTGLGGPHTINYFILDSMLSGGSASGIFRVNGATVTNSTFSNIKYILFVKSGSQAFTFQDSTIDGDSGENGIISLEGGLNNTIRGNNIDVSSALNTAVTWTFIKYHASNTSINSTIEYNTYKVRNNTGGNTVYLVDKNTTAPLTARYNDADVIQYNTASNIHFFRVKGTSNNIYNNNLLATTADVSAAIYHYETTDLVPDISGDELNYTGTLAGCGVGGFLHACATAKSYCSDVAGHAFSCSNTQYSTTAGVAGCVGHRCNRTEN